MCREDVGQSCAVSYTSRLATSSARSIEHLPHLCSMSIMLFLSMSYANQEKR